jgi:multiple sugar transport system ATP-binding protein
MATIELHNVEKRFDELQAVKPMDLTIHDGEFVVLLGPSGCGKTTTLRMVCGLEAVTGGQILIDGRDVTWANPSDRDIAMVFQFFALYPHMNAWQNIAFPLQSQGEPREEVRKRVDEVARMLGIDHLLDQKPGALSGGDKQRVGLARAMVREPAAFLMDEPIGALDADARETMRAEIKQFHLAQNATTVYVTHDQVEAMALGDRIVVMSMGTIQQVGTPAEVYYKPANLFVANFIGSPGMNLIHGDYTDGVVHLPGSNRYAVPPAWQTTMERELDGEPVILGFRPESAWVSEDGHLTGEVYATDMHGAYTMLHLSLNNELIHVRADRGTSFPIGTTVRFNLDPQMVRFFDPHTEDALQRTEDAATQDATSTEEVE